MAQFSMGDGPTPLTAEAIAESMLELVVDGKYPGGTVLRHDDDGKRVEGPSAPRLASAVGERERAWLEKVHEPIRELLRGERGVGA